MKSSSPSSLRSLRAFCVAAKHESFSIAAQELYLTSSAISHQIKNLEEELGQPLFVRSKRDLSLTDAGRLLFDDISPLIEQIDTKVASFKNASRRKTLRISVQPFFASEFFVPRLREFTAKHPEIDIQVGTSDETPEKHPTDADLSIRLFKSPPAGLESNLLFPLRMVPAGSPAFKKALKIKNNVITSEFPVIVHETRPRAWKNWAKDSGITLPSESKITRLDSMIAVVRAAEQGIGAALIPVPLANLWFEQGSIVRLFDSELVADVSYYLVSRESSKADDSLKLLRSWILETFSEAQ